MNRNIAATPKQKDPMKHATATSKRQNYTNWMEEDRDLREMQGQTELDAGGGGGGTESDWTTAN